MQSKALYLVEWHNLSSDTDQGVQHASLHDLYLQNGVCVAETENECLCPVVLLSVSRSGQDKCKSQTHIHAHAPIFVRMYSQGSPVSGN